MSLDNGLLAFLIGLLILIAALSYHLPVARLFPAALIALAIGALFALAVPWFRLPVVRYYTWHISGVSGTALFIGLGLWRQRRGRISYQRLAQQKEVS